MRWRFVPAALAILGLALWGWHAREKSSEGESNPSSSAVAERSGQTGFSQTVNKKQSTSSIQEDWRNAQAGAGTQGLAMGKYFEELMRFGLKHGAAAAPFLQRLLNDPDRQVRWAALRALGATGSVEAETILKQTIRPGAILEDAAQATLALGGMKDPAITGWLKEKWNSLPEGDLKRCVMDTLTGRPWAETSDFFPGLLQNPALDPEAKASVLSNLGFHQEAPIPLFTPFLNSPEDKLRAGAYEGLAFRGEARLGQHLIHRCAGEKDPSMRGKAYEAIGNQLDVLPLQMATLAVQELDPDARLRAERAWGITVGRSENAEDQRMFDAEAVPRLLAEALENPDPGEQRVALQALAMAQTEGAVMALEKISKESKSARISRLAQSLSQKVGSAKKSQLPSP